MRTRIVHNARHTDDMPAIATFSVAALDCVDPLLAIGATKAEHQPSTSFRVFLDPAGHPFCLVKI